MIPALFPSRPSGSRRPRRTLWSATPSRRSARPDPDSLSPDGRFGAPLGTRAPHGSAALSVDAFSLAVSCGSRGASFERLSVDNGMVPPSCSSRETAARSSRSTARGPYPTSAIECCPTDVPSGAPHRRAFRESRQRKVAARRDDRPLRHRHRRFPFDQRACSVQGPMPSRESLAAPWPRVPTLVKSPHLGIDGPEVVGVAASAQDALDVGWPHMGGGSQSVP